MSDKDPTGRTSAIIPGQGLVYDYNGTNESVCCSYGSPYQSLQNPAATQQPGSKDGTLQPGPLNAFGNRWVPGYTASGPLTLNQATNIALTGLSLSPFGEFGPDEFLAGEVASEMGEASQGLKITDIIKGFNHDGTFHGLDQIISRGVTPQMIKDTVLNPLVTVSQSGGRTLYLSQQAAIVLDKAGQVVTGWTSVDFNAINLARIQQALSP